jgi:hypothetical protein
MALTVLATPMVIVTHNGRRYTIGADFHYNLFSEDKNS